VRRIAVLPEECPARFDLDHSAFEEQRKGNPFAEKEIDGRLLLAPDWKDPFPARERSTVTASGSVIESETFELALMCSSFFEKRTLEVR
jgi:hypothetical protein